ncbi:MAG: Fic family protein [Candidatus Woesearchaeota archaeon]|jgi:fido (protein-threonine AMPylation protein)|nr:Fic family protein [Candidatus Woesearchaeota archaeon]
MVTKYDVFYEMLTLRKKHLEEKKHPEKLGISVKEIANYFEIDYDSALFHIKNLLKDEYILEKGDGTYLPYVNRRFDEYIFQIYECCKEIKIDPNNLLNEIVVEIIRKGLGRRNIKLSEFYPEFNERTLKKYFGLFIKHNFVLIGDSEKPAIFHFNDDYILRLVLKVFGKVPLIDIEKYNDIIDVDSHVKQIVKQLKIFDKNKAIYTNKYKEISNTWRIHFITHTTALEGNTMGFSEVKELLEEGSITLKNHTITEIDENRNAKKALEYLDNEMNLEYFGIDEILNLHKIILTDINKKEYEKLGGWEKIAGVFRDHPVYISGNLNFKMSEVEDIEKDMDNYVKDFNLRLTQLDVLRKTNEENIMKKINFATWVHSQLQHIHPFGDGNSRTSRMLFNYILQRLGLPLIDIYASLEYMKHTKKEKKRDDENLKRFFIALILDNLKKMNLKMES